MHNADEHEVWEQVAKMFEDRAESAEELTGRTMNLWAAGRVRAEAPQRERS